METPTNTKKKVLKCVIDDAGRLGVFAIGLVEFPAIEETWVAMAHHKFTHHVSERRMLYGAAMVPDKYIYRVDEETNEEFYVYFDAATIAQCAQMFLKQGLQNEATFEHEYNLDGCIVVESWIVEGEQDKTRMFGMDLPVGTWVIGVKVENDEVWDKVKNNVIKGFSIEGRFAEIQVNAASVNVRQMLLDEITNLISEANK
jgi:hypothetical protein